MITAKKNAAYYLSFPAIDSATPASYKSGVSPVDTAYYKDGAGIWTSLAITDTATEIGSTGVYEIDLTAAEMNHDKVIIKFSVSGMADDAYQFDLKTKLVDDLNDVASTDIVSGGAINTTAGAVDTVTTNTDMRGTDGSNTTAPDNATIAAISGKIIGTLAAGTHNPATAAQIAVLSDWIDAGRLDAILDAINTSTAGLAGAAMRGTDGANTTVPDAAGTGPTNAQMEARTPSAAELAYIVSNAKDGKPVTFTGGTTTTAILGNVDGIAASSQDDVYNSRILVFNAGTLNEQVADITNYVGATKTATITAVTTAVTSAHTANLK